MTSKIDPLSPTQEGNFVFATPKKISINKWDSRTYEVRKTTKENSLKSQLEAQANPTPKKTRKVLTPSKSATLISDENHDCGVVNTAHSVAKTSDRLLHSMNRFGMAYALETKTERRQTDITGAHANCNQECHAAHSALTTTMYDDLIQRLENSLKENGFDQIDPILQKFATKRLDLSEEDRQSLASKSVEERSQAFSKVASRLNHHEKRRSFRGSSAEYVRGATIQNPAGSNKIDSHLERHLRPLEDELAEKCRIEELTPKRATMNLQETYRTRLEIAKQSLTTDLTHLEQLHHAWDALIAEQSALRNSNGNFEAYVSAVDKYLTAFKVRFTKLPGAPSLKEFKSYLTLNQSNQVLKTILSSKDQDDFDLNDRFLKEPADAADKFEKAKQEVRIRLAEVEAQLSAVDHTPEEIKSMQKYLYGKKDAITGMVNTPSKEQIADELIDLIPSVSEVENKKRPPKKRDRNGDAPI